MEIGTEFAALAATAATTIVSLLATDSWSGIKDAVIRLWRRHPSYEQVAPDLDEAHEKLMTLMPRGDDQVQRADLIAAWRSRLAELLVDDPLAARELREFIDHRAEGEPRALHQTIKAHVTGGGDAYVAGRDLTITRNEP